jgi:hypothetical protein
VRNTINIKNHEKLVYGRTRVALRYVQLRNTPDIDTKLSPAKALYGRELRDLLSRPGSALMGEMWNIVTQKSGQIWNKKHKLRQCQAKVSLRFQKLC